MLMITATAELEGWCQHEHFDAQSQCLEKA